MADHVIVQIELARLRAREQRSHAAQLMGQRVGEAAQPASLANILRLATRSRERIERITARAQQADQRGEAFEREALEIHDEHDLLMEHIQKQYADLEKYNSEMRAQLGNDVPLSRDSKDEQKDSSTGSGG